MNYLIDWCVHFPMLKILNVICKRLNNAILSPYHHDKSCEIYYMYYISLAFKFIVQLFVHTAIVNLFVMKN